jgi:hypothetical protein
MVFLGVEPSTFAETQPKGRPHLAPDSRETRRNPLKGPCFTPIVFNGSTKSIRLARTTSGPRGALIRELPRKVGWVLRRLTRFFRSPSRSRREWRMLTCGCSCADAHVRVRIYGSGVGSVGGSGANQGSTVFVASDR